MEFISFILATLLLSAIPGPTNALLMVSAAVVGLTRSVHLLAAALTGYLTAVVVLRSGANSIATNIPHAGTVLRFGVAIYLLYLAVRLWTNCSPKPQDLSPVAFRSVLITTLLNPKAIVLAFAVLPVELGIVDLLPWLAVMAALIAVAGAVWLGVGAGMRRGLRSTDRKNSIYRISAVVLTLIAVVVSVQSLAVT